MKCKCTCCELGGCDCIDKCEAKGLKTAWTDSNGEFWWEKDKPESLNVKVRICKDCRENLE